MSFAPDIVSVIGPSSVSAALVDGRLRNQANLTTAARAGSELDCKGLAETPHVDESREAREGNKHHTRGLFRGGAFQHANVVQVAIFFGVVQPVPDHKLIRNLKPYIAHGYRPQ